MTTRVFRGDPLATVTPEMVKAALAVMDDFGGCLSESLSSAEAQIRLVLRAALEAAQTASARPPVD